MMIALGDKCKIGIYWTTKTKKAPIVIMDNAFIGANSTILKGVTTGENTIIGACSVVTKSIPANQF